MRVFSAHSCLPSYAPRAQNPRDLRARMDERLDSRRVFLRAMPLETSVCAEWSSDLSGRFFAQGGVLGGREGRVPSRQEARMPVNLWQA